MDIAFTPYFGDFPSRANVEYEGGRAKNLRAIFGLQGPTQFAIEYPDLRD